MGKHAVTSISYDPTAQYLAAGGGGTSGSGVTVLAVKEWASLLDIPAAHSKTVSTVCWAKDSSSLYSAGMDRAVKVYTYTA